MADDLLYHFSDEDDDEDALLDRAFDRWEQLGGGSARGPLFQFHMQPIGGRRRWREVVERAQFNTQLRQLRDPVAGDNIGMALTEALHHTIKAELDREQRPAHHFVNFAITAHGFTHPYQTANFTVGEFLKRTARLDEILATLAGKLNSNESFNPDRGFQVDVVFVSMPGPGSGHRKQSNSGRRCLDRENKKTQCIVPIKNRDALCCARAIVTMRAHCHKDQGVDGFRQWDNLKRGRPVQQHQAQELHRQAGVAVGWSPSNVNRSKPVSSAKPSTPLFPTDATSVGTPNVPCVRNRCPSMSTSVTFNPWWRKRGQNQQRRGEVAWWRHPLPCLFTPILKPCRMLRGSSSLICCVIRPAKKRPFMCWTGRIVAYNFFVIWMTWSMCWTVMESVRFSWCFTI